MFNLTFQCFCVFYTVLPRLSYSLKISRYNFCWRLIKSAKVNFLQNYSKYWLFRERIYLYLSACYTCKVVWILQISWQIWWCDIHKGTWNFTATVPLTTTRQQPSCFYDTLQHIILASWGHLFLCSSTPLYTKEQV